eukprot:9480564-Pyramimonas_sp.AAC.1
MRSDSVCVSSFLSWMWCADPLSRTQERVRAAVDRGGSTVDVATDSWTVSGPYTIIELPVGNIEKLEHSVSATTVGSDL